jgi:hypothetical protein
MLICSLLLPSISQVNADQEIDQLISDLERALYDLESLADVLDETVVLDYLIQKLQEVDLYVETLGLDGGLEEELLEEVKEVLEDKEEILEGILTDDEGEAKELVTEHSEALDEFIEAVQEAKEEEEISPEIADEIILRASQIKQNIGMGGLNLLGTIEELEMNLLSEILEKADILIIELRDIVSQLQALGVEVEIVLIEQSPAIPAILIAGAIIIGVGVGTLQFMETRTMEEALEYQLGRQLSLLEKIILYVPDVSIPATFASLALLTPAALITEVSLLTGVTVEVLLTSLYGYAMLGQYSLLKQVLEEIGLANLRSVKIEWIKKAKDLELIFAETVNVINEKLADIFPPFYQLYAGGSAPGVVYKYVSSTQWDVISQEIGYAVLSLAEYNGKLYAGTLSTSDPWGGVGRVYRYDGGTTWTLVGDNLDDQVSSLIVYKGKLYAGTSWVRGRLYRYDGDTTWTMVVDYGGLWTGFRSLYMWNDILYIGDIFFRQYWLL